MQEIHIISVAAIKVADYRVIMLNPPGYRSPGILSAMDSKIY